MKYKLLIIAIILTIVIFAIVVILNNVTGSKHKNKISNIQNSRESETNSVEKYENNIIDEEKKSEKVVSNEIKVVIDNIEYVAKFEENETTKELVKMFPLEIEMSELNGNEKCTYLDKSLPVNSYNPNRIETGDVMLFGNNCLVVFYKSFNSSFSYTKVGHIDNLPDLGSKDITIKFEMKK